MANSKTSKARKAPPAPEPQQPPAAPKRKLRLMGHEREVAMAARLSSIQDAQERALQASPNYRPVKTMFVRTARPRPMRGPGGISFSPEGNEVRVGDSFVERRLRDRSLVEMTQEEFETAKREREEAVLAEQAELAEAEEAEEAEAEEAEAEEAETEAQQQQEAPPAYQYQ